MGLLWIPVNHQRHLQWTCEHHVRNVPMETMGEGDESCFLLHHQGTNMHYGEKASHQRQYDALGSVLLGIHE